MLQIRLLTALIGIPLTLLVIYRGGMLCEAVILLLAIIGYYEYLNMSKQSFKQVLWLPGYLALIGLLFTAHDQVDSGMTLLAILLVTVFFSAVYYPKYSIVEIAYALFGAFYIGFLMRYAIMIGYMEDHFAILILTFLITWGNDTGGYIFGRIWGKAKLAPNLSPKKTIAGSLGGVMTAAVAMLVFILGVGAVLSFWSAVGLVLLGSLAAQLGDLFISLVKRTFGVKDAGFIIPGHGGVLDRFDSFLLVVPFVYFFFR